MLAIAASTDVTRPDFVEVSPPDAPRPGHVLCRTLELGVCGTDREILLSAKPWTPVDEDRLILGHECLAGIEAVRDGVGDYRRSAGVVPVFHGPFAGQTRRAALLPVGSFTERGIGRQPGFSQPLWLGRP